MSIEISEADPLMINDVLQVVTRYTTDISGLKHIWVEDIAKEAKPEKRYINYFYKITKDAEVITPFAKVICAYCFFNATVRELKIRVSDEKLYIFDQDVLEQMANYKRWLSNK